MGVTTWEVSVDSRTHSALFTNIGWWNCHQPLRQTSIVSCQPGPETGFLEFNGSRLSRGSSYHQCVEIAELFPTRLPSCSCRLIGFLFLTVVHTKRAIHSVLITSVVLKWNPSEELHQKPLKMNQEHENVMCVIYLTLKRLHTSFTCLEREFSSQITWHVNT